MKVMCAWPSTRPGISVMPLRLDHLGARRLELAALGRDGADALAFDQHIGGIGRGARAVPHAAVSEQDAGHGVTSVLLGAA